MSDGLGGGDGVGERPLGLLEAGGDGYPEAMFGAVNRWVRFCQTEKRNERRRAAKSQMQQSAAWGQVDRERAPMRS